MSSESAPQPLFDERLLDQLACPVCHGDLRLADAGLHCVQCGRVYPVVEGIPVLIAQQP